MATYDFTVRAEDETGAFADRTFSIEVKNDMVERFVAVENTHAYSSVDGVNWTIRTGQGGKVVKRVGNYWIVSVNTNASNAIMMSAPFRISSDAINWYQPTFPCRHVCANSFHLINGWYYFLGDQLATNEQNHTIYKTQDFQTFEEVFKMNLNPSLYTVYDFPLNMLYSNNELLFFSGCTTNSSGQQHTGSGLVRYNITTNEHVVHSRLTAIVPTGSQYANNYLFNMAITKVNDAFIAFGQYDAVYSHVIPHYTFDFQNFNSANTFTPESGVGVGDMCRTPFIYHNGLVITVLRNSCPYVTKDLVNYSRLRGVNITYLRDIISYKGHLFTIPSYAATGNVVGKLYKGSVSDYTSNSLTNVSESSPVLSGVLLNSVAVIK